MFENSDVVVSLLVMSFYRRRLPHWHPAGAAIFLTWRLYGSLPCVKSPEAETPGERLVLADRKLDLAMTGLTFLKIPEVAQLVAEVVLDQRDHYELYAWVIMSNHVHVLLKPYRPLSEITRKIKNTSARRANLILGRTGLPFWQDESFDHWVRSGGQFQRIVEYIENNPVKAGLVNRPNCVGLHVEQVLTCQNKEKSSRSRPAPLKKPMRLFLWLQIPILLVAVGGFYLLFVWPLRDPHPAVLFPDTALAIRDAKIYTTPDDPPIDHGTVLTRAGVIVAIGPDVAIPQNTAIVECPNCTVTAGFWNCHVHLTESKWDNAAFKNADELNAAIEDMLTSRGFTTIIDLSSDPRVTVSLRRRIETGDLRGPAIYTAGSGLYPPNGIPYYLGDLPFWVRWMMPQPETPEAAMKIEERNIARGADVLKLFTGSIVAPHEVKPMPFEIAKAAVEVAHRYNQVTFAHPTNLEGSTIALDSGVDVLAHAPSSPKGIDRAFIQSIVERRRSMIPTLKMFATTASTDPAFLNPIYDVVREFHDLGGDLMFGTDVGYMHDYSTVDEFAALAQSGLNARDMLRMLTVAPAARMGVGAIKGTVTPGKIADLVVLDGDPMADIGAFSRVHFAIRTGRLIFGRSK